MMSNNKRDRLIDSAAILFHQQGITSTSLADIAKHADIPIGNVYYYFKTKDELAIAAIAKRREQFSTAYKVLEEHIADPRQRLIEALYFFEKVRVDYMKYGCPIGKIISDATPDQKNAVQLASGVFEEFITWAQRQFAELGHGEYARRYATSLMAGIQGATIMAKSMGDEGIISDEIARMVGWLEMLPNKKIQLGKVLGKTSDMSDAAA